MKYYKIVGRADIKGVSDDDGLKALDGYFESEFEPFDDNTPIAEVADYLCDKYSEQLSQIRSSSMTIEKRED